MNLQQRIVGILTNPSAEWPVIAAEPHDVASLYTKYILILAAIPALGVLLAVGLFSPFLAVGSAISTYISSIVTPIIAALVIEQLAPKFKSSGNTVQALKLVAFASTPVWISGIFLPLTIIGALYSIYLFYVGLGPVLHTPLEQRVPFMVVAAIVIVVVTVLLNVVSSLFGF